MAVRKAIRLRIKSCRVLLNIFSVVTFLRALHASTRPPTPQQAPALPKMGRYCIKCSSAHADIEQKKRKRACLRKKETCWICYLCKFSSQYACLTEPCLFGRDIGVLQYRTIAQPHTSFIRIRVHYSCPRDCRPRDLFVQIAWTCTGLDSPDSKDDFQSQTLTER